MHVFYTTYTPTGNFMLLLDMAKVTRDPKFKPNDPDPYPNRYPKWDEPNTRSKPVHNRTKPEL